MLRIKLENEDSVLSDSKESNVSSYNKMGKPGIIIAMLFMLAVLLVWVGRASESIDKVNHDYDCYCPIPQVFNIASDMYTRNVKLERNHRTCKTEKAKLEMEKTKLEEEKAKKDGSIQLCSVAGQLYELAYDNKKCVVVERSSCVTSEDSQTAYWKALAKSRLKEIEKLEELLEEAKKLATKVEDVSEELSLDESDIGDTIAVIQQ